MLIDATRYKKEGTRGKKGFQHLKARCHHEQEYRKRPRGNHLTKLTRLIAKEFAPNCEDRPSQLAFAENPLSMLPTLYDRVVNQSDSLHWHQEQRPCRSSSHISASLVLCPYDIARPLVLVV